MISLQSPRMYKNPFHNPIWRHLRLPWLGRTLARWFLFWSHGWKICRYWLCLSLWFCSVSVRSNLLCGFIEGYGVNGRMKSNFWVRGNLTRDALDWINNIVSSMGESKSGLLFWKATKSRLLRILTCLLKKIIQIML